jgi:hypothetical protein
MNKLYKITLTVILLIVTLVAESATNEIDLTEKELFRITTPDNTISAVWIGVDPNIEFETSNMPLKYGVHKLYFEFSKTKEKLAFNSKGELFFDDWYFNIFSPNYRFVALLQDHYGPYHIIPINNLREYLTEKNSQLEIVNGQNSTVAAVHKEMKWLSIDEIEFKAWCCGGSYIVKHKIGGKTKYGEWKP